MEHTTKSYYEILKERSELIKPEDAKKISTANKDVCFKEVMVKIRDAADKGFCYCHPLNSVIDECKEQIIELGYKIEYRNNVVTKISWE